jgi:hypothetical protein
MESAEGDSQECARTQTTPSLPLHFFVFVVATPANDLPGKGDGDDRDEVADFEEPGEHEKCNLPEMPAREEYGIKAWERILRSTVCTPDEIPSWE